MTASVQPPERTEVREEGEHCPESKAQVSQPEACLTPGKILVPPDVEKLGKLHITQLTIFQPFAHQLVGAFAGLLQANQAFPH